jgi:hypothetical protein
MKQLYFGFLASLAFTSANAQIVVSVEAPAALEGNYSFTWAAPDQGWGTADLVDPLNSVLDTAVFAFDDTAADSLACDTIVNISEVVGKIAVVYRGSCNFSLKALNAQDAGAVAVIIINNIPGPPVAMGAGSFAAQVTIPVVMITDADGALLRPEIEAGNVVVFIGNKAGLYDNDLGFFKEDMRTARATAQPKLVATNGTEFAVQPGCWVHNYGNNDQTGVTVTVTAEQGGTNLYTQTSPATNILSGDSAFFTLPDLTQTAWGGFYSMNYTVSSSVADEYPGDNSYDFSFLIDSLLAYGTINDSAELSLASAHYRPSTGTNFTTCVHFKDPNASRIAAMGLYTSGSGGANATMEGEFLETNVYQWDDAFTGLSDAAILFDNLNVIGSGEYVYDADLDGVNIYIPFFQPVMLQDDVRYLFCVSTFSADVFLGYDDVLDYDENITLDDQPICPISNDGTWFALGFGTDVTSAIGVLMGNFDVGVDENAANQVVNAYPNPATDRVWLDVTGLTGTGDLVIRTALGQYVSAHRMNLGAERMVGMDLQELANGAYLFELRDAAGKVRCFRVVVAR